MAAPRGRSERDAEEVQTALRVSPSPLNGSWRTEKPRQYLRPPSNFPCTLRR
jgi:hypothetical protein